MLEMILSCLSTPFSKYLIYFHRFMLGLGTGKWFLTPIYYVIVSNHVGIAKLAQRWTRDQKVSDSAPGRSGESIVFSRINFLCWLIWCPFRPHVTAVAHKIPRSFFSKSAGGRLHINTHTPLTKRSRSGLTMLSRNSVGNPWGKRIHTQLVRERSSSRLNSLSHRALILT